MNSNPKLKEAYELLSQAFARGGVTEITIALKKDGKYSHAAYTESPSASDLAFYASLSQHIAVVPDLEREGLRKKGAQIPTLGLSDEMLVDSNRMKNLWRFAEDRLISARHLVTIDLDLKDSIDDFLMYSVTKKREVAFSVWEKVRPKFQELDLAPSLGVYSGNGLHFHFLLKDPVDCSDRLKYRAGYLCVLKVIQEEVFGGEYLLDKNCAPVSQPIRLPGSTNYKDPKNPIQTEVWGVGVEYEASSQFHQFFQAGMDEFQEQQTQVFEAQQEHEAGQGVGMSELKGEMDQQKKEVISQLTFRKILNHFHYDKPLTMSQPNAKGDCTCSSPFSKIDRTPSCQFNDQSKRFYDWSSGKNGDILRFLAEMMGVDVRESFQDVLKTAEAITGIRRELKGESIADPKIEPTKEKRKKSPKKEDYFKFFDFHLKGAKKCYLTHELKIFMEGMWQPVLVLIRVLEAHAIESRFIKHKHLIPYLALYEKRFQPELLVEIPPWDTVDRLKQVAGCLSSKFMSSEQMEEILKEWGSRMFERLEDSYLQNFVLIFKGPQGIGKDVLIQFLVGQLGPLFANLTISSKEADNLATLADHLVLNISEFDRTNRTEMSTIKDWVTRPEAVFRRPYERSAKKYQIHTSFISSANVKELLRDHTGNRRFVIIDLESIEWDYPQDQGLQVLAQFRELSRTKYRMSEETFACVSGQIELLTPVDPDEMVLEDFDYQISRMEEGSVKNEREFYFIQIRDMLADMVRIHNLRSMRVLQNILKMSRRTRHTKFGTVYFRELPSAKGVTPHLLSGAM
jgi:hypothetical protein